MEGIWEHVGIVLLGLFGAAQLAIGAGILWQTAERAMLWLRGHRARGTIATMGEERDADSHRVYRPTVEFTTASGELRRVALADTVTSRPRVVRGSPWSTGPATPTS